MRNVLLVCVCFWWAVFLPITLWSQEAIEPDRKLVYKTVDGVALQMHVFEPPKTDQQEPAAGTSDRRAAIVFFFGGGWVKGNPNQFYPQCRALADRGMVAFSAEYRTKRQNKTTPFECVKDGKSAVRWIRAQAEPLKIDPERIVAAGGSAGGHIAACTGIIQGVEEANADTRISSLPNAMILFNPVLDTTKKGYGAKRFKTNQRTALSPCHHVRSGVVPTLVMHGDTDKTVPWENADRFRKLMKEMGNVCELVTFPGRGHGFFNQEKSHTKSDDADYNTTLSKSIDFLTAHGFLNSRLSLPRK